MVCFLPFSAHALAQLRHLTKHRANCPSRRPPSNYRQGYIQNDLDLERSHESHELAYQSLRSNGGNSESVSKMLAKEVDNFEGVDGRRSVSPFSALLQRDTDDSEQDSDGAMETSHQVDALIDAQMSPSWKNRRYHDHFRKHRQFPASPSVLTSRIQASEALSKPTDSENVAKSSNQDHHPVLPADSLLLAKAKGHLYGSSPRLKPKLTKPLKLNQPKNKKVPQNVLEVRSDPIFEDSPTGSVSRSLDIPENSLKTKHSLLTDGKAASFDSNFSLRGLGPDSDEEIMV